ncbi:UNKNOWN [Stylonychia lemnae]|uniref:Uncharacterized protein n=1 Tax=Stylonychia lemnae TaxID=5949 RepID=A0A078A4L0_STYLE|nr:UNKNOWN [Stylonychia lemnae]|eukprot:CDW75699.1 UNKNOWN [Stylonychia lemnae]
MSSREIERRILRLAIDSISSQISALSKCLEMTSKNLDNSGYTGYVGSIQNFAPSFFDHVNKNAHLEVVNRVQQMQVLLTKIRNRGMDIETLTSGPGIVFTYKDLNECLQQFCNDAISYSEKELRLRTNSFTQIVSQQKHLIYIKDRRIEGLKRRVKLIYDNITRIVNSRVYEKGNSLIFELDRSLREKKFYQDHIFVFEKEMKEFVREEFRLMLQRKDLALDIQKKMMKDVGNQLVTEVKAHVLNEQKRIKKQIKQTARKMRDLDSFKPKQRNFYQIQSQSDNNGFSQIEGKNKTLKNIENDDLMNPNDWVVSPEEATLEMLRMQDLLVKQRSLWMLKFQTQQKKYEDQIELLKNKLTSNTALWEQLQESDKRSKILQQELTFTQKSLSQCEKIIEKLKEELKQSEQERVRLFQYKQNKAQRLEELEHQVKKIDISEHINITKVIDMLSTKDKELSQLKKNEKNFEERLQQIQFKTQKEKHRMHQKYDKEVEMKSQAINQMNNLKNELQGFELNSGDKDQGLWRNKCKDLLEICQNLTEENFVLTQKLKEQVMEFNSIPLTNQKSLEDFTQHQQPQIAKKSRNKLLAKEDHTLDSNLFASDNSAYNILPNIKQSSSIINYSSQQYKHNDLLSSSFLHNESINSSQIPINLAAGSGITGMLINNSINMGRQEGSPFKQPKSENSEYQQTDLQNSMSSFYNSNLVGQISQIKPIKQIMGGNQYQLLNSAKTQLKSTQQLKNRQIQKRNISTNSYSNHLSAYDIGNGQHSTSISALSNNTSDRNAYGLTKIRNDPSMSREIYQRTERNLSTADNKKLSQYEDFSLRGHTLRKKL